MLESRKDIIAYLHKKLKWIDNQQIGFENLDYIELIELRTKRSLLIELIEDITGENDSSKELFLKKDIKKLEELLKFAFGKRSIIEPKEILQFFGDKEYTLEQAQYILGYLEEKNVDVLYLHENYLTYDYSLEELKMAFLYDNFRLTEEQEFEYNLFKMLKYAKKKHNIIELEEIARFWDGFDLSPEDMEKVFVYLEENNIDILRIELDKKTVCRTNEYATEEERIEARKKTIEKYRKKKNMANDFAINSALNASNVDPYENVMKDANLLRNIGWEK